MTKKPQARAIQKEMRINMIFVILIAVVVASIIHLTYKNYMWGGKNFDDKNPYLSAGWKWPDGKKHNDPPPAIAHRFFVSHNAFDSPRENFKLKLGGPWYIREYSLKKRFVAIDLVVSIAGGSAVLWLGCKLLIY